MKTPKKPVKSKTPRKAPARKKPPQFETFALPNPVERHKRAGILTAIFQDLHARRCQEPDQVLLLAAIGGWRDTKKEFLKAASKLLPAPRLDGALSRLTSATFRTEVEDKTVLESKLVEDTGDRFGLTAEGRTLYNCMWTALRGTHHAGLAHKASLTVSTVSRWNCWLTALYMALLSGPTSVKYAGRIKGRWRVFWDTLRYVNSLHAQNMKEQRERRTKRLADTREAVQQIIADVKGLRLEADAYKKANPQPSPAPDKDKTP